MKQCAKCRAVKRLDQFNVDRQKKDSKRSWCKKCNCADTRRWAAENPDRKKASAAVWYSKSKKSVRENQLLRSYGLTLDSWQLLAKRQGNKCALCRTTAPKGKGAWHVDHDHKTGTVRGLLCHACNIGLGHFKDNPKLLLSAIKYLQKHQN